MENASSPIKRNRTAINLREWNEIGIFALNTSPKGETLIHAFPPVYILALQKEEQAQLVKTEALSNKTRKPKKAQERVSVIATTE